MNNVPGISQFAEIISYADDANVLISGKNLHAVLSKFEYILATIVGRNKCLSLKFQIDNIHAFFQNLRKVI